MPYQVDPGLNKAIGKSPLRHDQLGEFADPYILISLAILLIITICCLYKLWRKEIEINRKIKWTLVLLIPLFGVLIYGYSFYEKPVIIRKKV